MRHFSTQVPLHSTFVVELDWDRTSPQYATCVRALMTAMDANPHSLVPNESSVLKDFDLWFSDAKRELPMRNGFLTHPTFVYSNLNTGITCVFITCATVVGPEGDPHWMISIRQS